LFQKRSVGVCIILTLITCGIYGLYWFYKLTEEINIASEDHSISPGAALLFTILTCGIYGIYWSYKMGKNMSKAQFLRGMSRDDNSILYLILSIFGLSIVVYAILQSELNSMVL